MDEIVIQWSELERRLLLSVGGWTIGAYRTRNQAEHAARIWVDIDRRTRPLQACRQPMQLSSRCEVRDVA